MALVEDFKVDKDSFTLFQKWNTPEESAHFGFIWPQPAVEITVSCLECGSLYQAKRQTLLTEMTAFNVSTEHAAWFAERGLEHPVRILRFFGKQD